eukprot:TRINITY_DN443_c0_g1_i2.p1 TRINITY_DN443_c0_g1~~TRINITY_DN443_c0_g1_i2.p1  ORF type:complete len:228 (-),score=65.60 TRINITY_DN443_c0_g1_i2:426-1109(-)
MAQPNLFSPLGLQQGGGAKPLVEYRCGKMNTGTNQQLVAEKRKGILQVLQTPDALMHFVWKDRTTGSTEDDLIIFPGEATFKKLKQVENGRVFLLEFPATSRRLFFWSQEAAVEKDEDTVSKVNQFINNPPAAENQEYSFSQSINQSQSSQSTAQSTTAPNTLTQNTLSAPIQASEQTLPIAPHQTSNTSPETSNSGNTTAFNSGDLQLQLQNILASFSGMKPPEPG